MEKKLLGPLVLVVLIIGSILSSVVLQSQDEEEIPEEQPTPTPGESREPISFIASGIDANVHQLTNTYFILGYTDNTNLVAVIDGLRSTTGIERITSPEFLSPDSSRERFMPFKAEIVISRDSNFGEIAQSIEESEVLTEILAERKAVVKIPTTIAFFSEQQDLNLARDANFEEPFTGCFVSLDSMTGDNVVIAIKVVMRGDEVERETMEAGMQYNFTAEPKERAMFALEEISALMDSFGFLKTIRYTGFDEQGLKADLEALEGVETVELSLENVGIGFSVLVDRNSVPDINALERDSNTEFSAIPGIESVYFHDSLDPLEIRVTYDKNASWAGIRQQATAAADSLLPDLPHLFQDPNADLSGVITFADANAAKLAAEAKAVFLSYGAAVNPWQDAFYDLNALKDEATGEEFSIPEDRSSIPLRVEPGTQPGDKFLLEIVFNTQRDLLLDVSSKIQE